MIDRVVAFLVARGMAPEVPRQFVFYAVVGTIGTLLDFALLWLLLRMHCWPAASVTIAYFSGTVVQFFLNRHYSFRAFDRAISHQAATYVAVTLVNWLVALGFVEAGIHFFAMNPLLAKVLSIPPSVLVGFTANRHLTFGPGIRATYRRLRGEPYSK